MAEEIVETKDGKILMETYDHDLLNSMDATDATTVQELLQESTRRLEEEKFIKQESIQRSLLKFFGTVFFIISIAAVSYSVWYYMRLTVPIMSTPSIGVFPQTESFVNVATNIDTTLTKLDAKKDLVLDRPYLVPISIDTTSGTLISTQDMFDFLKIAADEPLQGVFSVIRLGVINQKDGIHPFIIGYVQDPILANKEFLLNENKMTTLFEKSLQIKLSDQKDILGGGFSQATIFNLNFRVLKTDKKDPEKITMLYGNVTPNTVVFATNPDIIRSVYETLITQNAN